MRKHTETQREVRNQIATFAAESFANHELAVVREQPYPIYKCAKPGTWCCGFFVAFIPGGFAVYGDIGEASIFQPYGANDVLAWLRGAVRSESYLLKKRSGIALEDFYAGDALAALAQIERDEDGVSPDMEAIEEARAVILEDDSTPDACASALYETGQFFDSRVPGYGPAESLFWTVEALMCFVRLHDGGAR